MSKCARSDCGKTVYPMEELKCLDKVWHKQCFRCAGCNMVLNLKNYKGYNKTPYCEAHCPKVTATVVADTPEFKRLQENTKIQSQVKYHEDFERMKGKKTDVTDDPETQRHMKNSMIQSNAAYHGESERKEQMERIRPPIEETVPKAPTSEPPPVPPVSNNKSSPISPPGQQQSSPSKPTTPYSNKMQQSSTLIYSSDQGGRVQPQGRAVGSIADYDPLNGQWGSVASVRPNAPSSASYSQKPNSIASHPFGQKSPTIAAAVQKQSPTSPGRIGAARTSGNSGVAYRAMYDYTANDSDEISFKEGDVITNCQSVDNGWMTGTCQRTGKWGMLPANYVERVH